MSRKSIKEDISDLKLFKGIKEEDLEFIADSSIRKRVKKGNLLFSEKSKLTNIYIVLDGKVSLFRLSEAGQKRVIFILDKGEIINEVVFDNLPSSISCEAFEDSIILGINKEALIYIMSKNFILTQKVMNSMGKKARRLYRQLKNTVPIRMDKKLAAKLWKLSKDYGKQIEEGILIDLDLSVTYLSDMLGSTRETISRCVSDLQNQELISYKGKKIVVNDRERLAEYFKGLWYKEKYTVKFS